VTDSTSVQIYRRPNKIIIIIIINNSATQLAEYLTYDMKWLHRQVIRNENFLMKMVHFLPFPVFREHILLYRRL